MTTLDPISSNQQGQHTFSCDNGDLILQASSNSAAPILVWADVTFKTMKINILGSKHVTTINVADHGEEDVDTVLLHAPRSINVQPHFLLHYQTSKSNWAEVYHIDFSSGSIKKSYDLPRVGGKGAFSTSTIDTNIYFTRNTDFEVVLVSSVSHGVLERWPVRPKSHDGLVNPEGIASTVSEVVPRGDSKFAVRSAVALSSGDWQLVRNGDPVWLRLESLAGVVAAGWAEVPVEEDLVRELATESQVNVLSAYIHRVRRHARDLQRFPSWLAKLSFRIIGLLREKGSTDGQTLERDSFGFNKVVIAVTEKGRVIALDTGNDGRILWSTQAVNLPRNTKWQVRSIEIGDKLAVISAANGELVLVDNLTGDIRKYEPPGLITDVDAFITLPGDFSVSKRITINKDGVPSDPEGVLENSATIVTKLSSGSIAGWRSLEDSKQSLAWEFAVPQSERIYSIVTRPTHDPVASIGKALGDRNVLYKYLNPNLVLITATSLVFSTFSVYLLDSISGQTLYTNTHFGVDVTKQTATTFSENWFAYTLYSDPSISTPESSNHDTLPKGYQIVISELYESPFPNDRGPLESAQNFSALNTNPNIATIPHVFSQSYVLPGPISHLTTTSTLQGITPRSLLCTLPTLSALLAIPITFLSPRRPINRDPTAAEAEEGLYKYNPLLDFNPQWIITHKREVLGLKGVITTPTLMESTSLVFAYGDVDVYGTRVAPIGTFDVLGKGFSRLQLVGTVAALAVGTGVLAPMVSCWTFTLFFSLFFFFFFFFFCVH